MLLGLPTKECIFICLIVQKVQNDIVTHVLKAMIRKQKYVFSVCQISHNSI